MIPRGTLLRLSLVAAVLAALAASTVAFAAGSQSRLLKPKVKSAPIAAGTSKATASKDVGGGAPTAAPTRSGLTSVIVKLDVTPLASYRGGVAGYAPTTPNGGRLNMKSGASQSYFGYLTKAESSFAANVRSVIPQARVADYYRVVYGGVAMLVPPDRIPDLARMPGVVGVHRDTLAHPDTDHSPTFIGAPSLWQQIGSPASNPQNEIVAVLDTGIWPEHPSFSPSDATGIPFPAPPPPLSGSRLCQFSTGANPGPAFGCNNKLIAAQRFMDTYDALVGLLPGEYTSARDDDGHGTHTSSTAAGDVGVNASIFGIPRGQISGIAPRAHVMMYKVCGNLGCFGSDSMAAVEKAITDGANVINFSISGGNSPYGDAVELSFLDAYNAGVFVAASAGNSGPTPDTVAHRGPWVTSVGASTEDRAFASNVRLRASNGDELNLPGVTITPGISTPTPVVDAASSPTNDPLCEDSAADGAFTGKIVVCERGVIGRAEKGFNVVQRGAAGMILYNPIPQDLDTDNHWLPAIHIDGGPGAQLVSFLASHSGVISIFPTGAASSAQGDVMAAFSSRGGPGQALGVSKPDVTAPGVQILAGNTPTPVDVASGPPGELFQAIQGTSMSSPHVAGAAALLKALHPDWTPGEIKSALMTTAKVVGVVKEDGTTQATPFDDGSGRIDLTRAGDPGITFDVPGGDYVTLQDDLYRTNYPSIYVPAMPGIVTLQRTAHSELSTDARWNTQVFVQRGLKITVPDHFAVSAGGDTTFNITIDGSALPDGAVRYGYIRLESGARAAVLPVTIVRGQSPVTFDKTCSPASIALGHSTTCTISATNTAFQDANVTIDDQLPQQLQIVPASITGANLSGNGVHFTGSIAASQPPTVAIAPGTSPAGGYLPLSLFGIPPIGGVDDDTVTNFTTDDYSFGGETWGEIGISSNGYAIIGGSTSASDNQFVNQSFPDPNPPNNVLAPFWADLNPGAAGAMRIAELTDGSDIWIVLDWDAVREFGSGANTHSFEIWIGIEGDANPGEDITYAYGPNTGNGAGSATVGAENKFGNDGVNVYYNGTGTLPTNGTQLRVTTTPGVTTTKTITFDAVGVLTGAWRNCAQMTADIFFGTAITCFDGEVG